MKERLVGMLRCPVDRSALRIESVKQTSANGEILSGRLMSGSGRQYPIVRGVPYLHTEFKSADEAATVGAFGEEWARYDDFAGYMGSSELFSDFSGLRRSDVEGRRILEVGCGGGRWLRVLAEWGAEEVVGVDYSAAVDQASALTSSLPKVHVVRGSALELPFAAEFDLVVCIGVLHHLIDPVQGLRQMRGVVKPVHTVVFWVYGLEGNELYLALVRPLRLVGPRLPSQALVGLSRALASLLWCPLRTSQPIAQSVGIRLPLASYSQLLRRLRFRDLESVVYDQLTPTIARYPKQDEVLSWVARAGGRVQQLTHRTENSWQCHLSFLDEEAATRDRRIK